MWYFINLRSVITKSIRLGGPKIRLWSQKTDDRWIETLWKNKITTLWILYWYCCLLLFDGFILPNIFQPTFSHINVVFCLCTPLTRFASFHFTSLHFASKKHNLRRFLHFVSLFIFFTYLYRQRCFALRRLIHFTSLFLNALKLFTRKKKWWLGERIYFFTCICWYIHEKLI